jgi:WD40 repeat protein
MLASGDTDSVVIVWHFQDTEAAPDLFGEEFGEAPGGEGEAPSENWSVFKILRGHLQDVTSLDFSPCGTFLVSCSTDNTAIVFDVNKGTKVKMLSDHKGWVNGVVWDPLNKFIGTLASDRCVVAVDPFRRCFERLILSGFFACLTQRATRPFARRPSANWLWAPATPRPAPNPRSGRFDSSTTTRSPPFTGDSLSAPTASCSSCHRGS